MWQKIQQSGCKEEPGQKAFVGIFPADKGSDKDGSSSDDSALADGIRETSGNSTGNGIPCKKSWSESGVFRYLKISMILIGFIKLYQHIVSPWLPRCCRFTPTCSQYALDALEMHGLVKGLLLTCWRLLRCQPFCKGGHDPVPLPGHRIFNLHKRRG
jgi:putative membrane protein insertion efficiency factor